ncbi:hypothetical protein HYV86_01715 [Candidatus Woesearchaeota archaeon]|nr:hypothetical protein [Candidatus Woesearchaeota archaeon]
MKEYVSVHTPSQKITPYVLSIFSLLNPTFYQQQQEQQRLLPTSYTQPHHESTRFEKERRDTLKFTAPAHVCHFPLEGNQGLYGFTYRGTSQVHLRDDLSDKLKIEVDLHECGHTPDEYETRRRTDLKLESMFPTQERYHTKPPEYRV